MPPTPTPPASKPRTPPAVALALPVAVWLLMLAWWTIPPYRGQIQDHEPAPLSWDWQLDRPSANVCDVQYFDMKQGGATIERWRLLGFESPEDMPPKYARIREPSLLQANASVCRHLRKNGERAPEVEVIARCDADGRFELRENREHNVCAPRPTTKARSKKVEPK